MSLSCHGAIASLKGGADLTIALAGNPNVGKSSVFNHLTGLGAVTANYPGKTVEVNLGSTAVGGEAVALIDLPGTYALGAVSEDQWVARRALLDGRPDAVLAVVDATNLSRNLYLVLQLLDLGLPVVLALNLFDEAERRGIHVDPQRLASQLGSPVVATVATRGSGLDQAMSAAARRARSWSGQATPSYGEPVDRLAESLASRIEGLAPADGPDGLPDGLSPHALALLLLEGDLDIVAVVRSRPWGEQALAAASEAALELTSEAGEPAPLLIPRRRHGLAARIARQVTEQPPQRAVDPFLSLTTSFSTGIPILLLILAATFGFLFFVGSALSTAFGDLWLALVSPIIQGLFYGLLGEGVVARTLLWGFDDGIQAALAVGIPYVLTFYFLLALLEDSGYLTSVAFLADQAMRRLGLQGRAIIPLVAGAGCNVPAIIGTRVLTTTRQRIIASTLIVLVPCSARTAVILGAVSLYLGWQAAVAMFGIVGLLVIAVGLGLNRAMPGGSGGLVVEMFPFRWPHLATTAKKTWYRFREFLFVAMPIVVVGSLALGALYETNYIWALAAPLTPVIGVWLGLPAVAGLTLLFAVLRKELALQLLLTLAIAQYGAGASNLLSFMGPRQLFVYALVNAIYIPCVATIAVLSKELGWRRSLLISAFTVALALLIGGVADRVIAALGWL